MMLLTRLTARTAAMITVVTLTVAAQSPDRPTQPSMRSERAFATELQRAFRTGDRQAVTFPSGRRTVELGGRVAELGADGYVVFARAGDRLRATMSGFPAGSLWLRVSRRGSDTFLDGGRKGDSVWETRLADAGEYVVEVVRRAPYCDPPVIGHLLSLSLSAQPLR